MVRFYDAQEQEQNDEEEKQQHEPQTAEENKTEVEGEEWHASVRGASVEKKQKRGNRGSLDGTRRFRKVVTFRNSMVQTREIAGRKSRQRGRNSLLPWFSKASEDHTQEVLEEQERVKAEKAAKKAEKEAKKAAKKEEKEAKKAAKKAAKQAKKQLKKNDQVLQPQSLIFEDNELDMDVSLSVHDIMGDSTNNHQSSSNMDSFAGNSVPDHTRRRRSSVSTAILDTMRMFAHRGSKNPKRRAGGLSASLRAAASGSADASEASPQHRKKDQQYDWSSHLRAQTTPNNNQKSSPHAAQMTRQKSQQEIIEEEEDQYEEEMSQLPNSNPAGYNNPLNESSNTDFNASFATSTVTKSKMESSMGGSMGDISGESFADPNAPDHVPKKRGRKKSILGVFGTKSAPKRKPTPKRMPTVQESRSIGTKRNGASSAANSSCDSSVSSALADLIQMEKLKN